VLEDISANGRRHLRLQLSSPRGAERIGVQVQADVVSATVQGKPLASDRNAAEPEKKWSLIYLAPPQDGIELVIETESASQLVLKLVDESYGLPLRDGVTFKERPPQMMPAPFFRSDFSFVSQDYSF
jgi:hypothetical protein